MASEGTSPRAAPMSLRAPPTATLAEPWDPAAALSLDEHFAQRRAARSHGDGADRAEVPGMAETPEERAERERFEAWHASLPVDDEPLSAAELATLSEPWDPADNVTLEAYLASRAARAS